MGISCRFLGLPLAGLFLVGFALPGLAGRPVAEVLRELVADGRLIFTSELVKPELRVVAEPRPGTPLEIAGEILAPHGLRVEVAANGTWLVVRAAARGGLEGWVRQPGGQPLAGVVVKLGGDSRISDEDGYFRFGELAPGAYDLSAGKPGFVVEHRAGLEIVASSELALEIELRPAPLSLDEIVVTPSRISLLATEPAAGLAFSAAEIAALPHLGDDLFRALTLLPGISGNELSARFHVRGGRADEVMVVLDQLELFEPFHLRDFSDALSIVAPQAVAEVDLLLGGLPASYGDRMGGVLEMRSARPAGDGEVLSHLGLSILNAQVGGGGHFAADRGSWLAVARYGSLDALRRHLSDEERPRYWDAFVKADFAASPARDWGVRLLRAEDRLAFDIADAEGREAAETFYRSTYLWLTQRTILGSTLLADTVFSLGRVDRDRRTLEVGEEDNFSLRDEREHRFSGLRQDWSWERQRGEGGQLYSWGLELRHFDSLYDYENERELADPLAAIRSEPRAGTRLFAERIRGEFYGFFVSRKAQLHPRLTSELGLRFDEQQVAGDSRWSPRFHVAWALSGRSVLRFSWGHYFQSQRPYELRVEDGETRFLPSERTEQAVVAYERDLRPGWQLRCDAYSREVRDPRPRFENIFEPISSFPEIEPDRVRFTPAGARSRGLELFLRGRFSERLEFWLSYAYSRSEDEIAGRYQPRGIDQPHNLSVDLAWRAGAHWTLNLALRWHTGWPTTAVSAVLEQDEDGEPLPRLLFGPIYGERLPDYHRLDLRASRSWQLRRGRLSFFLDLQNLYDRENLAGYNVDFGFEPLPDDQVRVVPVEEVWGGFLPSLGLDWSF